VPASKVPREQRATWRIPPLALLKSVTWSPAIKLGMLALRGYLVVAALLLLSMPSSSAPINTSGLQ
jgi:hypothetical protein